MERYRLTLWSTALCGAPVVWLLFRVPVREALAEFSRVRGSAHRSLRVQLQADVRRGVLAHSVGVESASPSWAEVPCCSVSPPGCWLKCPVAGSGSLLGTPIPGVRCEASAHCPWQANETRLAAEEEVRPYHPGSLVFPVEPRGLCGYQSRWVFTASRETFTFPRVLKFWKNRRKTLIVLFP